LIGAQKNAFWHVMKPVTPEPPLPLSALVSLMVLTFTFSYSSYSRLENFLSVEFLSIYCAGDLKILNKQDLKTR
jgi:hypothetical protein